MVHCRYQWTGRSVGNVALRQRCRNRDQNIIGCTLSQAIEAYQKALTINPDYAKAQTNLGNVYLEQGKYDLAIKSYQKALTINSDDAWAHCNLGVAYHQQGRYDLAIEAYNKEKHMKSIQQNQRQLFLDNELIHRLDVVKRTLRQPCPDAGTSVGGQPHFSLWQRAL